LRATLVFVIYTMAGSLLMLASIIVLGLSQGTFDLVQSGTNGSDWIFLGFVAAFAVKAPIFPLHAWLPGPTASRRPRSRRAQRRRVRRSRLRLPTHRDRQVPGSDADLAHADPRARRVLGSSTAPCSPSAHPICAA
jgi:hypothetical protein